MTSCRMALAVLAAAFVLTAMGTSSSAYFVPSTPPHELEAYAIQIRQGPQATPARPIPQGFQFKSDTYRLVWNSEFSYSSDGAQPAAMDEETRARVKNSPKLVSEHAQYAALRLDGEGPDGLIVVIFDESGGTGKGFDTAYIDANRNWDLSDDEPVQVFPGPSDMGRYSSAIGAAPVGTADVQWVRVKSHQGPMDGWYAVYDIQIRLWPRLSSPWPEGAPTISLPILITHIPVGEVRVEKKGAWTGKAAGASGEVEIALVDMNNNGMYGDRTDVVDGFPNMSTGDPLLVNGTQIRMTEATRIAGRFYHVRPNCIGNLLTVHPYWGPKGTLALQASDIRGLAGAGRSFALIGSRTGALSLDGGTVVLPAGQYRISSFVLNLSKEGVGGTDLNCVFDGGRTVDVERGKPADIEVQGDLTAAIHTDQAKPVCKPGEWIRFDIVPKIGDAVTVRSVGGVTGAPQMDFINKAGKAVLTKTAGRP